MKTIFRNAALAVALAGATLFAPMQASAQERWRDRDRGGDDAAIAIGAGLVGLAIGAVIASDNDGSRYRRSRDYYYDDYYYRPRNRSYYYDNDRYYRNYYRNEQRWRKQARRDYRRDYRREYRQDARRWGYGR